MIVVSIAASSCNDNNVQAQNLHLDVICDSCTINARVIDAGVETNYNNYAIGTIGIDYPMCDSLFVTVNQHIYNANPIEYQLYLQPDNILLRELVRGGNVYLEYY